MATKPDNAMAGKSHKRLRTKEFFEEERKRAAAREQLIARKPDLQKPVVRQPSSRRRQVNPITAIWIAIFFFFIDYLASQKQLSPLIAWLLVVIPLLLVAIAFFVWGRRKQFPWLSFPFDPLMMSTINSESNNSFHAFSTGLAFLFLAIMATIAFFGK